ncbi:hypothetical protein FA95DRAFT_1607582 [Auriscalpium vulgare]|uniref:Uncharacterized protein n=1 Tax=Auriscalpium vulgare TaxID=40419 RepID=A0ACB8RNX5_9AGAM|nr:hypothetical protein FA95DRAFT_1607582 [Auriscalpium vulgare]
MTPPDSSGDGPPGDLGDPPDPMNIDTTELSAIVDTALEPAVVLFPDSRSADTGPDTSTATAVDVADPLSAIGDQYYVLHALLKIPVHSAGCATCTAFLTHQDPTHPSWAHVQEQFRIHQKAQFDSGVSHGLAAAAARIAAAEDIRRRAEDNVQRLIRQRDIARDSETAAVERLAELQAQLETIRLEHAELVRDHAKAQRALDRAQPPSRAQSPFGDSSSISSTHRRSPRPELKKRKRSAPSPPGTSAHRTSAPPRSSRPPSAPDAPTWTSSARPDIQGAQWARWVPVNHDDVSFVFMRAVSDADAAARIRTLVHEASDLAIADRTPTMRFMVQQWGTRRNTLATRHSATVPPDPVFASNGGGHGAVTSHHDTRGEPARHASTREPSVPSHDTWTTVKNGKRRSTATPASTTTPQAAPTASRAAKPPPSTVSQPDAAAPKARRIHTPAYETPIDDWVTFILVNPAERCPPGVPMHPKTGPSRRVLLRHLEIRLNGPQGRSQTQRSNRGHWVNRTTQLFSIRGLYGRVLHKHSIPVIGSVPTVRPYVHDTRNLSIEDVARHFASNGYQPRSLAISECEEYAIGRRNVIENRPINSTAEWSSYPRLADMSSLYPVVHAPGPSAGPPRNLYANMTLDLRASNAPARSLTPEGPVLTRAPGSLSPDFPDHYEPPTPHFVPISDADAPKLPAEVTSWADELYAVNNSTVTTVNNTVLAESAVNPAALPLPASRSASPMDATE